MSWTKLADSLTWSYGHMGKGYLLHDGGINTWSVDPYHPVDQRQRWELNQEKSPIALNFDIDPDGGVVTESPTSKVNAIVVADPRLYDAGQRPVWEDQFDLDQYDPAAKPEHKPDMNFIMSAESLLPVPMTGGCPRCHSPRVDDESGECEDCGYVIPYDGHEIMEGYDANGPVPGHQAVGWGTGALDDADLWRGDLGEPHYGASDASADELHVGLSLPKHIETKLRAWVDKQDWPEGTELEDPSDYHITLLYSPGGHGDHHDADWISHTDGIEVKVSGLEEFGDEDEKAIVLRLDSGQAARHAERMQDAAEDHGLEITHFPGGYKPHITLAYGPSKPDVSPPELSFKTGPSSVSSPRTSAVTGGWEDDPAADDYRMQHRAPGPDSGWSITNMAEGMAPQDFYENPHYYMFNDPEYDRESYREVMKARGNPEAPITIHRAAPINQINPGDWITLSHSYAKHHALHPTDPSQDGPVWSARVPASSLYWNGDDLNEYGYHGPAIEGQRFYRTRSNPELRPGSEIHSSARAVSSWRFGDHQGYSNYETFSVAVTYDNDYPLYQAVRQLIQNGGTVQQLEQWAIQAVIAPHNKEVLTEAQEYNSIPEEERIDHNYEAFKDKHGDDPRAMDLLHGLVGGPDVGDIDPNIIDPNQVNWMELWTDLREELAMPIQEQPLTVPESWATTSAVEPTHACPNCGTPMISNGWTGWTTVAPEGYERVGWQCPNCLADMKHTPNRPMPVTSNSTGTAHFNRWTGKLCHCPWHGTHRQTQRHQRFAGEHVNKLRKAPDKAYKTPEGQDFLDRLLNHHPEQYESLFPYLAHRFKKGDIGLDDRPHRPRGLTWDAYGDNSFKGPLEVNDLHRWHQWYEARQHPTRRGVNIMDRDFGPAELDNKSREHQLALRHERERKERLALGKTVHTFRGNPGGGIDWHAALEDPDAAEQGHYDQAQNYHDPSSRRRDVELLRANEGQTDPHQLDLMGGEGRPLDPYHDPDYHGAGSPFTPEEQYQRRDALQRLHQQLKEEYTSDRQPGWHIKHLNAERNDLGEFNDIERAMEAEGNEMGHCIGQDGQPYKRNAVDGQIDAYSLRDAKGDPHATWHYNSDGSLAEMFGPNDDDIKEEYQEMLNEWGHKNGRDVTRDEAVGHQEEAEDPHDDYFTFPSAEDVDDYLRWHGDETDWEYAHENGNIGDDTQIDTESPDWDRIARDYLSDGAGRNAEEFHRLLHEHGDEGDMARALEYRFDPEDEEERDLVRGWNASIHNPRHEIDVPQPSVNEVDKYNEAMDNGDSPEPDDWDAMAQDYLTYPEHYSPGPRSHATDDGMTRQQMPFGKSVYEEFHNHIHPDNWSHHHEPMAEALQRNIDWENPGHTEAIGYWNNAMPHNVVPEASPPPAPMPGQQSYHWPDFWHQPDQEVSDWGEYTQEPGIFFPRRTNDPYANMTTRTETIASVTPDARNMLAPATELREWLSDLGGSEPESPSIHHRNESDLIEAPAASTADDLPYYPPANIPPEVKTSAADLYHVAPSVDRERIRQHGLQTSDPTWNWDYERQDGTKLEGPEYWHGQRPPEGVYTFDDPERAQRYVTTLEFQRGQPHDLWKIPGGQVQQSQPDPDMGSPSAYIPHPVSTPELVEGPEHRERMPEYTIDKRQPGTTEGRDRPYPQNDPEAWQNRVGKQSAMTLPQEQRAWEQIDQGSPVVGQLPNGYTVQHHDDALGVNSVGEFLHNCWQERSNDRIADEQGKGFAYHSLHDEHGLPRAAFYVATNPRIAEGHPSLTEMWGARNQELKPEHTQVLADWATQAGHKIKGKDPQEWLASENYWRNHWDQVAEQNRQRTADSAINQADATNDPLGKNPAIIPSRQGDPDYLQAEHCPACHQEHRPDEPCPDSAVRQYQQSERSWYNRDPNAVHGGPDGLTDHQMDMSKITARSRAQTRERA